MSTFSKNNGPILLFFLYINVEGPRTHQQKLTTLQPGQPQHTESYMEPEDR